MIGETISHYRIIAKIGAGGMGEVYRAHDPRLDREVAVKVMPASALSDPTRLGRFEREARSTGALNHPNIVAIYDVGQHQGVPYIVTELLQGQTLRQRLRDRDLTVRQAVDYGVQIAEGLAAAHSRGIIHRDLKPENVFLTRDGHLKILDFGLAKLSHPEGSLSKLSTLHTPTVETETGAIVGTLGYMSPEQLHGQPATQRSDIFAFGALMYEMLAGRRAFSGDSKANVVAAILRDDPPAFAAFSRPVPPQLEQLVRRCLDKRPECRYESAHDVALALRAIQEVGDWSTTTLRLPTLRSWRRVSVVLAAVVVLVAAVLGVRAVIGWRAADDRTPAGPAPLPETLHVAVAPFSAAGSDSTVAAIARGLSVWITDRFVVVEERLNGEVWAVGPGVVGARTLKSLGKEFGLTVALDAEVTQSRRGWRAELRLLEARTGSEIDARGLSSGGPDPCPLAGAAASGALGLLGVVIDPATLAEFAGGLPRTDEACTAYLEGLGWQAGTSDQGALLASVGALGRATAAEPDHAGSWIALARAHGALFELAGDATWLEGGTDAVARVLSWAPSDAEALVVASSLRWMAGEGDEAIEILERAAVAEAGRAGVHAELGKRYMAVGRVDDAEGAFQRAIRLRPADIDPRMHLGALYWIQGARDAAINQFREVIALVPENALAHSNLCGVYLWFEMLEEAREMCERSLAIEENEAACANLGYLAFSSSNFGEAVQMYERALELGEGDYVTYGNLGLAYHHMDRVEDSQEALRTARTLAEAELAGDRPDLATVTVDLAVYNALLGDREASLELLDGVAESGVEDPQVMFEVGEAYEDAGATDQALSWIGRALENGVSPGKVFTSPTLRRMEAFRSLAERYDVVD